MTEWPLTMFHENGFERIFEYNVKYDLIFNFIESCETTFDSKRMHLGKSRVDSFGIHLSEFSQLIIGYLNSLLLRSQLQFFVCGVFFSCCDCCWLLAALQNNLLIILNVSAWNAQERISSSLRQSGIKQAMHAVQMSKRCLSLCGLLLILFCFFFRHKMLWFGIVKCWQGIEEFPFAHRNQFIANRFGSHRSSNIGMFTR